jgi:hypothetical protein
MIQELWSYWRHLLRMIEEDVTTSEQRELIYVVVMKELGEHWYCMFRPWLNPEASWE